MLRFEKKETEEGAEVEEQPDQQGSPTLGKFMNLKEIDFEAQKGQFVCVIGDTGSGKSSLFSAVIGDMIFVSEQEIAAFGGFEKEGDQESFDQLRKRVLSPGFNAVNKPIRLNGTVSYVEQKSWIQNKTIKENILFGKPLDELKYAETIQACQLTRDLKTLPAGDNTEIGEKGINLSGGQKARISLARAVYADSDIVLLDDPISALDANVRKRIFHEVFQGCLKDKTRVLVTHSIDFLHLADKICVVQDGRIQAQGTYDDLKDNHRLQKVIEINRKNLEEGKGDDLATIEEIEIEVDSVDIGASRSQCLLGGGPGALNESEVSSLMSDRESKATSERASEHQEIETESDAYGEGEGEEVDQRNRRFSSVMSINPLVSGKMIANEEEEEVEVTLKTYKRLFEPGGGIPTICLVQLFMLLFLACNIGTNYTIHQCHVDPDEQQSKDKRFFYVSIAFAGAMGIFIFLAVATLVLAQQKSSRTIHNSLIQKVFLAPINLFFDVTPIGKILNRFSRDLSVIDEQIFMDLGTTLLCFYGAMTALVVAMIAVPWMIILVVIYLFVCYKLFAYAIPGYKETFRLINVAYSYYKKVVYSPILSFFQETFQGGSVVRAFQAERAFEDKALGLIDRCSIANLVTSGIWSWVCLRLSFMSTMMLAAGCLVCVLFRDISDPVKLSLFKK